MDLVLQKLIVFIFAKLVKRQICRVFIMNILAFLQPFGILQSRTVVEKWKTKKGVFKA